MDAVKDRTPSEAAIRQSFSNLGAPASSPPPPSEADLLHLQEELARARQARQRFFWAFSHELRTPLNAILSYNDLLAHGILGPLTEGQAHATQRMAASIVHLSRLLDDVFQLSEIESQRVMVNSELVALRGVAEEVVAALAAVAAAKKLALRLEGGEGEAPVTTDREKVRRILLNLCGHALNFTEQGGVTLRIGRGESGVRIDVIDTGPGFDEATCARIFEEFAPHGPAGRHASLDLALAHRLATLLSLRLTVASRVGSGSVFSLHIPAPVVVAAGG
jgi:signal transduction histidine kinase